MEHVRETPKRAHRRQLVRDLRRQRWVRVVSLALGVVVGLAAFALFARNTYRVGPAQVSATSWLSTNGGTIVELPPFGGVRAHTHTAPLVLSLRLDDVDVRGLQELAERGLPAEDLAALRRGLEQGLREAGARGVAGSVIVAAFVAWALSRSGRYAAVAAMVTAVLLSGAIAWAVLGFNEAAFREPRFVGTLRYAPGIIDVVRRRAVNVRELEQEITGMARDLANYYARPQSFASGGDLPGTFRVLHVTDIHLDPVGLRLSRELARAFDCRFIIDTGDINNLGTLVEGYAVIRGLDTSKRRVFVPGNHDSTQTAAVMRELPRVDVLDETSVTVDGLKIWGIADPATRGIVPDATPDPRAARRLADVASEELRAEIESGETTPDVIIVHNPAMTPPFEGLVPLILDGHLHSARITRERGTWIVNSGTTGGVSFRGLEADPHIPHTASILYYTGEKPRRLIAIDRIEVFGQVTQSSLSRTIVDESLLPTASATTTPAAESSPSGPSGPAP